MKKRIGLLGGTFSPIHTGHINIAKAALNSYDLDEVWFIVAGIPPHKELSFHVDPFLRYEMVKIATRGEERFVPKDFECQSLDISYTAKTVQKLNKDYPDFDFFFIMGEDSLDLFSEWRTPEIIAENVSFLVAIRSESGFKSFEQKASELSKYYKADFTCLTAPYTNISSTRLRDAIISGNTEITDEFLPDGVYDFIKEHHIYEETADYDIEAMTELVYSTQKKKRYEHCLRVADTAANLASNYLYPIKKAYVTGLIHDCAKHLSGDELIAFCKERGLPITAAEYESPYLLHGLVGGVIAKDKFAIDEEMATAISVHTRGMANMSLLDKIIFLADHIEPGRKRNKKLDAIRYMAYKNIDNAVIMILEDTVEYLKSDGRPIDSQTMETLRFYKEKCL